MKLIFAFLFWIGFLNSPLLQASEYQVLENKDESKFENLADGLAIRFGSHPFKVEIRGPEKLIKKGQIIVRPILKSDYFKSKGIVEERENCAVEGEPTPLIKKNVEAASSITKLKDGIYSLSSNTLQLILPEPFVLEEQTDSLDYELTIEQKSYKGHLKLTKPWVIHPVLAEILRQYKKISASAVRPQLPPHIRRVATDECYDTQIEDYDFLDKEEFKEVGRIGEYRVVLIRGWVFAAAVAPDVNFLFEKVQPQSMTFLGDKYSIELDDESVVTKNGVLSFKIEVGDFSGCFGAGCGAPVNVKVATVTVDKKGKMGTSIKKLPEP